MDDSELIPLSALQHFLYCPRQCGLIHVEQLWVENRFTAEGRILHKRTDEPRTESRRGIRIVTAMPIRSSRLGVSGIADVVEISEVDGQVQARPIEYKRGRPKAHRADEVQLCAQGMALEEMFSTVVLEGALFYGETRRRVVVAFDAELRRLTEEVAAGAHGLIENCQVPHMEYHADRCRACSLLELCRPRQTADGGKVAKFLSSMLA